MVTDSAVLDRSPDFSVMSSWVASSMGSLPALSVVSSVFASLQSNELVVREIDELIVDVIVSQSPDFFAFFASCRSKILMCLFSLAAGDSIARAAM